jgi:type IV pilus assembly protein PilW
LPSRGARRSVRGFSLIELMVGITIALIVTLAIFNVLTLSENRKRSTTAVNDINQSGAYSAYVLDRAIRSAGSGFSNQYLTLLLRADLEGCPLRVTKDNAAVAPRTAAYPAPFGGMTLAPVLAPVIIDPDTTGAASDVITVMSGSQGKSEVGGRVIGPSVNGVSVVNTFGFRAGDLVLFGHNANEGPCLVSQVAAGFTPQVPPTIDPASQNLALAAAGTGTYGNAAGTSTLASTLALSIGNATDNPPQFKMFGVDANQTLVAYDLLDIDGTAASQPVANDVLRMHAVYGVDTNDDNQIDAWVQPSGVWAPNVLRNGTVTSSANLRRIIAVHVALIMRTPVLEKSAVQASTAFTLFTGLLPSGAYAGPLPATESAPRLIDFAGGDTQRYRYRLIETTVPVRNNLL